jgi:hypothetical protein
MANFVWGSGGAKVTPQSLAQQRKVAEALQASGGTSTMWDGIQSAIGDIGGTLIDQRANEQESTAQDEYARMFGAMGDDPTREQLFGLASSPWANEGQSAVVNALLAQDFEQSDPAYKLGLEKAGLELEALKNPVADPFTLGENDIRFAGDGTELARGRDKTPDTLIDIQNGGATDKFYDKMDEKLAEQVVLTLEAGDNAMSNNIKLGQLETLLSNPSTQGAQGALVQIAGQFGIPMEGLDDIQAAQAIINQMVPLQRPPGSGTMSDADLALFKASLPAILNQPGGNTKIITTAKAINSYYIAQADIAERVANREISPAEGRKLQRAVPNPLDNIEGIDDPVSPAADPEVDDLVKKYGG